MPLTVDDALGCDQCLGGLGLVGRTGERRPARGVEVQHGVVAVETRRGGVGAPSDDPAAARGRGAHPSLDGRCRGGAIGGPSGQYGVGRGRDRSAGEAGPKALHWARDRVTTDPVGEGGAVQRPVVARAGGQHGRTVAGRRLRDTSRLGLGRGDRVALAVGNPDRIAAAPAAVRVHHGQPGLVPEHAVRLERGDRGAVAQHRVLQGGVVGVRRSRPVDLDAAVENLSDRRGGRADHGCAQVRPDAGQREPGQALLRDTVDLGELATEHHVTVRGLRRPGRLARRGGRAERQVGIPLQQAGVVQSAEVPDVLVHFADHTAGLVRDRGRLRPTGSGQRLTELPDRPAVVVVVNGIDHAAHRSGVVGITQAVVDPVDAAVGGVGGEGALESGHWVGVRHTGAEDGRAVGLDRGDRAARARGLDPVIGRPGAHHAVQADLAHTGRLDPVEQIESPTENDGVAARRDHHCVDNGAGAADDRVPAAIRTVRDCERGQRLDGGQRPGGLEVATDVHGVLGDRQSSHLSAHRGPEPRHQGMGGGVEGGDVGPRGAIDGGEVSADVDPRPVRAGAHHEALPVQGVAELRNSRSGAQVEGEDVRGVHLAGATAGHAGRPGLGELAGHVHGVTDDRLAPDHAVQLPGGKRIGADGVGQVGGRSGHARRRNTDRVRGRRRPEPGGQQGNDQADHHEAPNRGATNPS